MSLNRILVGKFASVSFILLAFSFFAAPVWAQGRMINVVTEEWAPYNYTEDGVLKGFSVEIVQLIIKKLNAEAQIQVFPSIRASSMLNNDPRTMMITMLRTPEREGKYKWIGPLGDGAIYFYKKKGNPLVITTLEDAKKVKVIGCRSAGLVPTMLRTAGFTNLDDTSTDSMSIYKKLLADRCDLGISDAPLGVKYLLKKMNLPTDSLVQTTVKVVESALFCLQQGYLRSRDCFMAKGA